MHGQVVQGRRRPALAPRRATYAARPSAIRSRPSSTACRGTSTPSASSSRPAPRAGPPTSTPGELGGPDLLALARSLPGLRRRRPRRTSTRRVFGEGLADRGRPTPCSAPANCAGRILDPPALLGNEVGRAPQVATCARRSWRCTRSRAPASSPAHPTTWTCPASSTSRRDETHHGKCDSIAETALRRRRPAPRCQTGSGIACGPQP